LARAVDAAGRPVTAKLRARGRGRRREILLAIAFIAPAVSLVAVLMYYPMARAIGESMYSSSFLSPVPRFIGLDHYRELVAGSTLWLVLRNSLIWTGAVVLLQNLLGLASALLLDQKTFGSGLVRALVLVPWVLPGVVAALLWRFMYDPQLGLVNSMLVSFGLGGARSAWLANEQTALAAVVLAAIWKGFPFSTVMYLAALQGLDRTQFEAAQIDGAGPWQRFRHVLLPGISGITKLNLLLTTIFTFNYFDLVWITTRGGPRAATHIFPTYIFQVGFGEFRFGVAAAYGVIGVVVLLLLVAPLLRGLTLRQG
jgi:multiple sugar transport system permease protein